SVAASGSESQNQRYLECRACKDGGHSHSCPATSPPCLDPAGDGRGAFAGSSGPRETAPPLQPSEGPATRSPRRPRREEGQPMCQPQASAARGREIPSLSVAVVLVGARCRVCCVVEKRGEVNATVRPRHSHLSQAS